MASIVEGYNYDIFISYRQKDNRHDGWVTEFVNNLKDELESTFKEEISVYFDINPHDGLLETHDVDASLKEKLKCLIFIPIISRTYCDPKSFAWEHEFRSFVEMASQDEFGLKIRLTNGNVATRVMPVKIHDLDPEDITVYESVLGILRGVDFIYREAGVNRPLAPEDKEEKNQNGTKYKNQINKTAIAIKELIEGIKCRSLEETKPEKNTHIPEVIHHKSPGNKIIAAVATLIIISGLFFLIRFIEGRAQPDKSIAVLPFVSLGSDEDKTWFSDGITDIIISQLSKIPDFRVLGWTTTQVYKEGKKPIREIGLELGVNYLVEGTIQRVGEKMRISVQLIRVDNEDHIWSDIYDREWKDIFELQSEISQKIAQELHSVLEVGKNESESKSPANAEAYNLYLQGRFFWNRRFKEDLLRSIEYYQKALSIDSVYAPAYAGLADSYYAMVVNSQVEPGKTAETYEKAEKMALKAISLDNTMAEPHGTLGCIRFYRDMKWEESRSEFKLAIRLNPNYPETYYQYAQLLDVLREKEEARSLMNKAIGMNPFQPNYRFWSADLYYNEGKFNEAISEARKNLELTPGHRNTYQYLINSYLRLGEELKAFESMLDYLSLYPDKSAAASNTKWAKEIYNSSGFNGLLIRLIEAYPENYFVNATRYAKLGKKEEAIICLEKAWENKTGAFFRINSCYDFNFLRSDPRFQALLEKLGLSGYQ